MISVEPMKAPTDNQGTATICCLLTIEETGLEVTSHVCSSIQHGKDKLHTGKQGPFEVPHTTTAGSRNRMKFKDCCVRGNKSMFIYKEHFHL